MGPLGPGVGFDWSVCATLQDVVQQEALISAYQRENEKLTVEVKELRKQLNGIAHVALDSQCFGEHAS